MTPLASLKNLPQSAQLRAPKTHVQSLFPPLQDDLFLGRSCETHLPHSSMNDKEEIISLREQLRKAMQCMKAMREEILQTREAATRADHLIELPTRDGDCVNGYRQKMEDVSLETAIPEQSLLNRNSTEISLDSRRHDRSFHVPATRPISSILPSPQDIKNAARTQASPSKEISKSWKSVAIETFISY